MRTKLCFLLLLVCCTPLREETAPEQTVCLEFPLPADTKSLYTENDLSLLKSLVVYGVDDTGYWKRATSQGAGVKMSFPAGRRVRFYALANMPADLPVDAEGSLQPGSYEYLLPEKADFALTGVPMAGTASITLPAGGGTKKLAIRLERLLAKVVVRIDKSALTGGVELPVLASDYVCVRQANRRLRPFGTSRAKAARDVYDETFDVERFPTGGAAMEHSGIVLYVPENRQGTFSELHSGKAGLCTYLEYCASKDGSRDGVSGPLSYRAYLGGNVADDYSVRRNSVYQATLSLTWDGFMWHADGWRIDASGITDGRQLSFLDASGDETECLRMYRDGTADVYACFSIDGNTSGTVGRKDADSYPYGWTLQFDGTRLSGHDGDSDCYDVATGLSVKCLGNAVVGGLDALHLQISATPSAALTTPTTRPRLSLSTTDGKVQSSPLFLDIEDRPFRFKWADAAPNHVGQKGLLQCVDPYTGAPATGARFSLDAKFRASCLLKDNGNGTAEVSLVKPFPLTADVITARDPVDDRQCGLSLEARLPYFESSAPWTTYVDACSGILFTYWACGSDGSKSGGILKVTASSEAGYTGNGDQLDRSLVQQYLAPTLSSSHDRIGFTSSWDSDGTCTLLAYIRSYDGLRPAGQAFEVDEVSVGMGGYDSVRPRHSATFTAWNPWKNITTIRSGRVLDDYTLYSRPDQMAGGWLANPYGRPSMDAAYTLPIQNPVVANEANVRFNAAPQYGSGDYLGSICSGQPKKTAADFAPEGWTLYMHVNFPSASTQAVAESLDRMRTYLNEVCGYSFQSRAALERYILDNGKTIVVSNHFASRAEALAARPSSIPYTSFEVKQNSTFETWAMTYTMKGKTDENMNGVHGAGPIDIVYEIKNAYSETYLRKKVSEIYMRLHVYYFPMVIKPDSMGELSYTSDPVQFGVVARDGNLDYLRTGGNLDNAMRLIPFKLRLFDKNYNRIEDTSPIKYIDTFSPADYGTRFTHPSGVSTFYYNCREQLTQNIYFNYYDSLTNGDSSKDNTPYIPIQWAATSDYEGAGLYRRSEEYVAYFDPSGKERNGLFWDKSDAEDSGCLIHLHIIPIWYYSYPLM